jgi:hypothetical protein
MPDWDAIAAAMNAALQNYLAAITTPSVCSFCGRPGAPEQNVRPDYNGGWRCVPCDHLAKLDVFA